ncbi:MAG: hypothetical protein KAS23_01810, partial [Anaerohalosphaera sp.]|nr:hypothetical protein [Anaerohalosphaera sp.]
EDLNRNGILDSNEDDAQQSPPSDNSNGRLDPGFLNYVTVYSYETNEGQNQKVNVNSRQSQDKVRQIIAQALGDETRAMEIMGDISIAKISGPHVNLIDFYFDSGMKYEEFLKVESEFTTSNANQRQGLVNINSAPAEVMLCLPGLEKSDVDAIITKRDDLQDDSGSMLWITKILSKEKAVAIGSFITNKSYQYGADIVAASGDGRAFRRYYVIIDTADGTPIVKYRRSLTHLGWPMDDETLELLRQEN